MKTKRKLKGKLGHVDKFTLPFGVTWILISLLVIFFTLSQVAVPELFAKKNSAQIPFRL